MPTCSCKSECTCLIGPEEPNNGLLFITGNGNPDQGGWKLRVDETVFDGVEGNTGIIVTPGGDYGHEPSIGLRVISSETVSLQLTPQGLQATAQAVPTEGGGTPTGVIEDYLGEIAPAGYLMASGPYYAGYVAIDDYEDLFAVVQHTGSGNVDPGNGTFLVPYLGEKFLVGTGAGYPKNSQGGLAAVPLAVNELPVHDHPASTGGSLTASATTDVGDGGFHGHDGAGANHDFMVENTSAGVIYKYLHVDATDVDTAGTMRFTSRGTDGDLSYKPSREQNTANAAAHDHPATTTVDLSGGVTVDVGDTGGGAAHENRPPFYAVNRIIKT